MILEVLMRRMRLATLTAALSAGGVIGQHAFADTLRIDNGAEPRTLDPQRVTGLHEMRIDHELYETLVTFDPQGKIVPGLAERWDVSDDGRRWTFHLREASWSDGTPITADDAVFAFQRALLPGTQSQNASLFYPILNAREINTGTRTPDQLSVRALDPHTFEVTLSSPVSYMLQVFADNALAPLPKHVIQRWDNTQWITQRPLVVSGPYLLDQWMPQVEVRLKKNPRYYQAQDVALDEAVFYPINNGSAALNRYRSGALDISYTQVPSGRFEWVQHNLPQDLRTYPVYVHYLYLPNLREGQPLADKRVREALNLAVDRDTITQKIIRSGQIPSWSSVPSAVTGDVFPEVLYFKDWSTEQRLAKARTLLREAGYGPDHPLDIDMSLNSVDEHRRIAVALSAMWKPLGINPRFDIKAGSAHYASIHQHQFQLGRYAFAGVLNSPADELSMFVSEAPNNYAGYRNPEFDQRVSEGIHATSPAAAHAAFTAAQRILLDDQVIIPILEQAQSSLVSPRVKGWAPNLLDMHPLRYMSLAPRPSA